MSFQSPSFQSNAFQSAVAAAAEATSLVAHKVVAAPQDVSRVREACGYGVVFFSLAALLVSAPPQVGAANYTTGTHQATVAGSQSPGFFKVTPATLIPALASARIGRTLVAAPEQVDSGYVTVFGRQPDGIDRPVGVTRVAAPAQLDTAVAWIFRPAEALIPEPQTVGGVNYTVGTHRFDDGAFVRTGRFFPPAVAGTAPIGRMCVSAPPQIDSGYVHFTGIAVEFTPVIFRTYYIEQDSTEQWGGKIWGTPRAAVVGTDKPIGITRVVAPPQIESGYVHLTGPQPGALVGQAKPFRASQQSTEQWGGKVWGFINAALDKPIGHYTVRGEPFYEPVQVGIVFSPSADLIPPPVAAPDPCHPLRTVIARAQHRTVEAEAQDRTVESDPPDFTIS